MNDDTKTTDTDGTILADFRRRFEHEFRGGGIDRVRVVVPGDARAATSCARSRRPRRPPPSCTTCRRIGRAEPRASRSLRCCAADRGDADAVRVPPLSRRRRASAPTRGRLGDGERAVLGTDATTPFRGGRQQ